MTKFCIDQEYGIHECDETESLPGASLHFSTFDEFKDMVKDLTIGRLATIWNRLPGVQPICKFENRKIALDRIWLAVTAPDEVSPRTRQQRLGGKRKRSRQPKTELVLGLLRRPEGATMDEIRKATHWQPHSVRGFISGKVGKALGYTVGSFRREGKRVYSISQAHPTGPGGRPSSDGSTG